MTEQEWLLGTDLVPMLKFLRGTATDRKLRLFACGLWRRTLAITPPGPSRQGHLRLLDLAERYSDGLATAAELTQSRALPEARGYAMQFCLSRFSPRDLPGFSRSLSAFTFENPEFSCRFQATLLHDL